MKRRDVLKSLLLSPLALLLGNGAKADAETHPIAKLEVAGPRRDGFYAWQDNGFAILDERRVIEADFNGCDDEFDESDLWTGSFDDIDNSEDVDLIVGLEHETTESLPYGVTHEMNELLRKVASCDAETACNALEEIAKSLQGPFEHTLLEEHDLWKVFPSAIQGQRKIIEVGADCSMQLRHAKDCRWDILACAIQELKSTLASKIVDNEICYVTGIHVAADNTMFKRGRLGFVAWVEGTKA